MLVLDDAGRNRHAAEDGLYHRLSRSGRVVCAADLRGTGDMRPEVGRGNPGYTIPHDAEEDFAWASLILGKSLLAQRIEDTLAILQALENLGHARVVLSAKGRLTIPALFAFALWPRAEKLYLSGGLASYEAMLESEYYKQPLANLAFDLYRNVDLPDLARSSAPRKIHLAGMQDGAGKTFSEAAVRKIYSSSNVQVSAEPAWDESAFQSL
ncbi:MAG: hypothetical protein JO022_05795 [Acidobacteriaceae bacterium]|nr:hypothetical protein [Acidobacteriaceae bacterium]